MLLNWYIPSQLSIPYDSSFVWQELITGEAGECVSLFSPHKQLFMYQSSS